MALLSASIKRKVIDLFRRTSLAGISISIDDLTFA